MQFLFVLIIEMCENDKCQYCKEDIVEWYETI